MWLKWLRLVGWVGAQEMDLDASLLGWCSGMAHDVKRGAGAEMRLLLVQGPACYCRNDVPALLPLLRLLLTWQQLHLA